MRRSPTQTKTSSEVSWTVQMRYLCHVMRQAESSRDTVQRQKNSCLQDAFVFFLYCSLKALVKKLHCRRLHKARTEFPQKNNNKHHTQAYAFYYSMARYLK